MLSLILAHSALQKLIKILCGVLCVITPPVMDRSIAKGSDANAYTVLQSMVIAVIELGVVRDKIGLFQLQYFFFCSYVMW